MWKILENKKGRFDKCECECGTIKLVRRADMKNGKSTNCGCIRRKKRIELNIKHGMCGNKFYEVWRNIKTRCSNKNRKQYKDYGGRGIKCEWKTFEEFKKDMYSSYKEGLTIDRIDNNGNYSKENCRWITQKENNRNRRITKKYNGKSLGEWSEITGIPYGTISSRINKLGWSIEKSLNLN